MINNHIEMVSWSSKIRDFVFILGLANMSGAWDFRPHVNRPWVEMGIAQANTSSTSTI